MKYYTITIVFIISLLAWSCNNSENNNKDNQEASIELNNGPKGKVNAEMSPYIVEAENILNTYNSNNHYNVDKQLKDQNKSLIKSCNMKGKSHDELRKWLHPHIQLVDALSKAESEHKAEEIIAQLKESFKTYNTYFQ